MPAGRPTKYRTEFAKQAAKLCEFGATNYEIAEFFGVDVSTLWIWSRAHPEFFDALKQGKEAADKRVEHSLYAKATGYTFNSEKIFMPANQREPVRAPTVEHVAPDTTAAIFWLKNRKPKEWRDKTEQGFTDADGNDLGFAISFVGASKEGAQAAQEGNAPAKAQSDRKPRKRKGSGA